MFKTVTVRVDGMSCMHCNMAIERAVSQIDGVAAVSADFETGAVRIEADGELNEPAVREAIAEEGYEVLSIDPGTG